MTRLALASSTWVPRNTIRPLSNLEYRSNDRSPRLVCSMTIGTRLDMLASALLGRDCRCDSAMPAGVVEGFPLLAEAVPLRARGRPTDQRDWIGRIGWEARYSMACLATGAAAAAP